MPIEKIRDIEEPEVCLDPDHNPPTHWCPTPGIYKHTCPSCSKITILKVEGVKI